jgi:hypothetical protein
MNADQIAEIRPAVREAIQGAPNTCVTLQIKGDPSKWVQIAANTVNAAYPHAVTPDERLRTLSQLGERGKLVSWKSGKFATFEFEKMEPTPLAHWIDAYFVGVLACSPGDYHVDVACEQI